mgnify:CR=1 FL=1
MCLTKRWLDDALRVETAAAVALDKWQHLAVTYDGSRYASGVKVFLNGTEQKTAVLLDELNQLVARQQQQIDLLLREVQRLRQQQSDGPAAPRNLRDELPPHY